jgi:benzoate membrane transport protein
MSVSSTDAAPGWLRQLAPPLSVAIPITIFATAAIAIPLATSQALGLTANQTGAWLLALYGIPGLLSLGLTAIYRQPLLLAWHTVVVAFLASLAGQVPYTDLLGATVVGGLVVALLGALGLTARIAALVPAPVVFAVVAANVLPFVVGIFEAMGGAPLVIAGTLLAYLLGRRFLTARVPPVLPAVAVGLLLTAVTGQFGTLPASWTPPPFTVLRPTFSLEALLTVVPVFVTLVAFQSNLTAVVYLRSEGYRPPMRVIDVVTGLGSALGSFLGPAPICMGALVTPLTAGPEAGEHERRHWSVYAASCGMMVVAFGAGIAAILPEILPLSLLLAIAGLALIGVLAHALNEMTRGPLRLGPLFAFVVALSGLSLFGLGALFWALVAGAAVSLLLEGDALRDVLAASKAEA